uniref:Uncharacterized protein n=1 Tax=Arundo donax TaxID=35708 RepID=A0A0A9HRU0_ARUDO
MPFCCCRLQRCAVDLCHSLPTCPASLSSASLVPCALEILSAGNFSSSS